MSAASTLVVRARRLADVSLATRVDRARTFLRRHALDLFGLTVAVLYALPTLAYRFGRDQAIFYYVGREWLHGRLPYRDSFDLKPPAIYFVHALAIAVFGPHEWAIRVLDLAMVLAIATFVAFAVQRDELRVASGEVGVNAVLFASMYFTVFDYWDTAQAELWEGGLLVASYLVVERDRKWLRAALVAGALAGLSVLFKFTAGLVGLFIGLLAGVRTATRAPPGTSWPRRLARGAGSIALFGAGSALVVGAFAAYFALHGAWHWVREAWGYLLLYARAFGAVEHPADIVEGYAMRAALWLCAFGFAGLVGLAEAFGRRSVRALVGSIIAWILCGLAIATVYVQRRFWSYHWGVAMPFFALVAAYGVAEAVRVSPRIALIAAIGLLTTGFLTAPMDGSADNLNYRTYTLDRYWPYVTHRLPPARFFDSFASGIFSYGNQHRIGETVLRRARPGDQLQARGFEVGFNVITGLPAPSRFVSELPIEDATLAYHRDAWRREHDHAVWTARPRFIVGFADRAADNQSIREHGYHDVEQEGLYLLFERNSGSTPSGR